MSADIDEMAEVIVAANGAQAGAEPMYPDEARAYAAALAGAGYGSKSRAGAEALRSAVRNLPEFLGRGKGHDVFLAILVWFDRRAAALTPPTPATARKDSLT